MSQVQFVGARAQTGHSKKRCLSRSKTWQRGKKRDKGLGPPGAGRRRAFFETVATSYKRERHSYSRSLAGTLFSQGNGYSNVAAGMGGC